MGCRPKTLLFALIEKADATRRGPTSKRMFSYGAIVANEITNNISLPFLMGWLFVATTIHMCTYIHTYIYVVRSYRDIKPRNLFAHISVSSYLVIERDFVVARNLQRKTIIEKESRTSRSYSIFLAERITP